MDVSPLSGHADFSQLMRFIEATGARKVYIFNGYAEALAEAVRDKLGVEASPLPWIDQRDLMEFI